MKLLLATGILLLATGILIVGMFFAPQLLEATNSSCGAVERLALRQIASSKNRGEGRADGWADGWAAVLLNFSNGAFVATALQQEYPGWPTAVSCAMTYYRATYRATLTGFRWREGSGSPDRADSPNPVPPHSAATEGSVRETSASFCSKENRFVLPATLPTARLRHRTIVSEFPPSHPAAR